MKRKTKEKWYKKPIWQIILITILLCIVIVLVDILNIPSRMGITSINIDAEASLINSIITVALFAAAYVLIDQWEAKKNKNKQEIAKRLLETTYNSCKTYLAPQMINVLAFAAGVLNSQERYEDNPFKNNEQIVQLAMDGVISVSWFNNYLSVKSLFETYINAYRAFKKDEGMHGMLESIKHNLLDEIEAAINALDSIIKEA